MQLQRAPPFRLYPAQAARARLGLHRLIARRRWPGFGRQNLMDDEEVLSLIRDQANSGGLVFSVCTGALLCGAAGILRGRLATTHWAAWDLFHTLPDYLSLCIEGLRTLFAGSRRLLNP